MSSGSQPYNGAVHITKDEVEHVLGWLQQPGSDAAFRTWFGPDMHHYPTAKEALLDYIADHDDGYHPTFNKLCDDLSIPPIGAPMSNPANLLGALSEALGKAGDPNREAKAPTLHCKNCGVAIYDNGGLWLAAVGAPLPMCPNNLDMHEPFPEDLAAPSVEASGDEAEDAPPAPTPPPGATPVQTPGTSGVEYVTIVNEDTGEQLLRFNFPAGARYKLELHTPDEPKLVTDI